jgi:hypothetical protein
VEYRAQGVKLPLLPPWLPDTTGLHPGALVRLLDKHATNQRFDEQAFFGFAPPYLGLIVLVLHTMTHVIYLLTGGLLLINVYSTDQVMKNANRTLLVFCKSRKGASHVLSCRDGIARVCQGGTHRRH